MKLAEGNYVVKTIEKVKELGGDHSLLEIGFEKYEDTVAMFGVYADVMTFLNQEVIVSFREEVIDGKIRQCVNNMSVISKVVALDREEDIKLYIDDLPDTGSTVNFDDIELGSMEFNAIVYCAHHTYDSSTKASWAELTVLDKRRNAAKVRLFDPDKKTVQLRGRYVKMDIKKTKFGFNTTDIEPVEGINISPNPEIELAKRFILQVTRGDALLTEFIEKSKIIDALSKYVDESEPEVGYMVVRVAQEMAQAREFKNMSPIVDTQLLVRACLLMRSYCLTNNDHSVRPIEMQNVINVSSYGPRLLSDKMMNIITEKSRVNLLERDLYEQIRKSVDILIQARKFRAYTLSTDKRWG